MIPLAQDGADPGDRQSRAQGDRLAPALGAQRRVDVGVVERDQLGVGVAVADQPDLGDALDVDQEALVQALQGGEEDRLGRRGSL